MKRQNVCKPQSPAEKRKALRKAIKELSKIASVLLPDGYMIAGFGLVETEVVEGEYLSVIRPSSDIWTMDVMLDIASSANEKYESCFEPYEDDQVVKDVFDKSLSSVNGG